MATMTQAEAIQHLKHRVKQLKAENADLSNENEELKEAISSIYEISADFSIAGQDDLDGLDLDEEN